MNNAEQVLQRAKSLNLSPDKKTLVKAKTCIENGDYQEAIKLCENSSQEIESLINDSKPSISISSSITSLEPNTGKKTQLILKNEGLLPAKNFSLDFAGDMDIRVLSEIDGIKPGDANPLEIWIKPKAEGDLPLDISLKYKDPLDRDYNEKTEVWINVTEPAPTTTSQPPEEGISPAQFSPLPSYTTSFPPEISHHYSEPQFVGKGGFARVFRTKREDGRIVAVKIPSNLDESAGKSFIREISVWQQLSHENIINLHDMNVFPTPYLELEYADGGSLDALKKPIEVEQASRLIFNVAEGLKHAHNQGIAHRDLKPQNILLTGDLTPKITDWGLSKVMAESKSSSRFGFTPIYAAPEQISPKKFGRPDFRTDIYQMGVVFYELATGKVPFEGEDFSEIGFAIISEEPKPPSALNLECSELDAIILKCLNKHPDDRYQTIVEFQQDLAGYLKIEYTKSLPKSAGDLKRSCIYCGDLVLIHAKINDVEGALKYAVDMKNYAGDGWCNDVEGIVKQLDYLADRKQPIGDELMTQIGVVLHQLKMGR